MARLWTQYRVQRTVKRWIQTDQDNRENSAWCRGAQFGRQEEKDRLTKLLLVRPDEVAILGVAPEYPRYRVGIRDRTEYQAYMHIVDFEAVKQCLDLEDGRKAVFWSWRVAEVR